MKPPEEDAKRPLFDMGTWCHCGITRFIDDTTGRCVGCNGQRLVKPERDVLEMTVTDRSCGRCGGRITYDSEIGCYHVCVGEQPLQDIPGAPGNARGASLVTPQMRPSVIVPVSARRPGEAR